jgi:hypothetical protein
MRDGAAGLFGCPANHAEVQGVVQGNMVGHDADGEAAFAAGGILIETLNS